jgi:hypothetical protein
MHPQSASAPLRISIEHARRADQSIFEAKARVVFPIFRGKD